jgi:hypothetical protein
MTRISLDLPDDIARRLEAAWPDMPRRTLEAVVDEGYRDGALTRDQVGRRLGLSSGKRRRSSRRVARTFDTVK